MKPKIKFKISAKKDIESFFVFAKEAHYSKGRNFEWAVFKLHSYFKKFRQGYSVKIGKKDVEVYVKNYYRKNKAIIEKNLELYKNNWKKIEKKYYDLVSLIFNKEFWPKRKYIAYATIWGMFPRFLEDKTFQIPYTYKNAKYVNVVIAHEMLHFVFYDYFWEKYPDYKKQDIKTWNISEIFNTVIQNSPEWVNVFEEKSMGYPEHKKIVNYLSKKYYKKKIKVEELIEDIIKEI